MSVVDSGLADLSLLIGMLGSQQLRMRNSGSLHVNHWATASTSVRELVRTITEGNLNWHPTDGDAVDSGFCESFANAQYSA